MIPKNFDNERAMRYKDAAKGHSWVLRMWKEEEEEAQEEQEEETLGLTQHQIKFSFCCFAFVIITMMVGVIVGGATGPIPAPQLLPLVSSEFAFNFLRLPNTK